MVNKPDLSAAVLKELELLQETRGTRYGMLVGVAGYAAETISLAARKYPDDDALGTRLAHSHAQLLALLCEVMQVEATDVMADVDRIDAIVDAEELIWKVKEKM